MEKISDLKQLKLTANTIRQDLIQELVEAKSGHTAGPLGMADVFTALYFNVLNHEPKNPKWPERDRLVLSNGHICPVHYATLANAGYFSKEELMTFRKINSRLQGHPHNLSLDILENTGGPLGQGLSQAIGMALAAKLDEKNYRIYCLMSDGEHDEGQTWEAVLFAHKMSLNNLTCIMDRNNIQIDGFTEDIMPLEPLRQKYEAFGWFVIEIDGHNFNEIINACEMSKTIYEKPTMIIAHTIPGKGVSFIERKYEWHGKPPTAEQGKIALKELERERELIERGEL